MLSCGRHICLVISMSVTTGIVLGRIPFDDWHCGSSDFTRRMSFESIIENCGQIMPAVNHCCVVHDVCYTHQLGQEECDERFCECNRQVAASRPECLDLLEASCSLVQLFGFGAYHNSFNYSEPVGFVKHTLDSAALRQQYDVIYTQCPKVNATTSSCAIQYNFCDGSPMECAELLSGCLHNAASVDGSRKCSETVAQMTDAVFKEANTWWNALRSPRFMGPYLLKLLMGACLVTLLYCALRLRPTPSEDDKAIKYSPV